MKNKSQNCEEKMNSVKNEEVKKERKVTFKTGLWEMLHFLKQCLNIKNKEFQSQICDKHQILEIIQMIKNNNSE